MGRITYVTLDAVLTGERIRSIIFEKGYTVRELQELLNLSCPQPVYRWMKGKILPSVDNLYMMHRIDRKRGIGLCAASGRCGE